ncbi:hypothetical protein [Streptomyces flavofungini]|uniref:XRE family transcriptional regulator n=1 Tax=Streptomyces flavofungini TaxID=68200 RepID=A0ABS0X7C6_9ACTN|nr:hypothetical protein [Streptomyces flavofungini]MBJ3809099.1 hypothetical protein [Streptomyces flavofungini]GHC68528.1 hypothetical protein GCM10010349_42700 [Streptomyces flavofungini]
MEFSRILGRALALRGISLDQIARELRSRGTPVSTSTLSAWQTGLSRPERASSLDAVAALEDILSLAPGQLRAALPPRRPRGRRPVAAETAAVLRTQWGHDAEAVLRTLAKLDADWSDLALPRPLSYRVRVRVGAHGQELVMHVSRVLTGGPGGATRMIHVTRYARLPQAPLVRMARGCRLARFRGDRESGVAAFEFLLDPPLRAGGMALAEFSITFPPRQTDKFTSIRIHAGTRDVVLEAVFEDGFTPALCQAFFQQSRVLPRKVLRELPGAEAHGHFQYIDFNPPPGIYGIRWA